MTKYFLVINEYHNYSDIRRSWIKNKLEFKVDKKTYQDYLNYLENGNNAKIKFFKIWKEYSEPTELIIPFDKVLYAYTEIQED